MATLNQYIQIVFAHASLYEHVYIEHIVSAYYWWFGRCVIKQTFQEVGLGIAALCPHYIAD